MDKKPPTLAELTEAFTEGRLAMVEAVLMDILQHHPQRAAIKRAALAYQASAEVLEEDDATKGPLVEARKLGREHTAAAIFHEMPQEPAPDSARKP